MKRNSAKKFPERLLHIGVDIDNVIADTAKVILAAYNNRFTLNLAYEELTDFYFVKDQGEVNGHAFVSEMFHTHELHRKITPYPGAREMLSLFHSAGHSIHYITARPHTVKDITIRWLKRHGFLFPDATLDLIHSSKFGHDTEYKLRMAAEYRLDVMMEDNHDIANNLSMMTYLFNRPWNMKKYVKSTVIRVDDWIQLEEDFMSVLVTKVGMR